MSLAAAFRKLKKYLLTPVFRFNRVQFNGVGLFFITVGLLGSLVAGLVINYLPKSKALAETTHTIGSGGNTELTSGTGSNVSITASNVTLSKDSNWYSLDWNYKRQLTIRNLSSATLSADTAVQITLDTSSLESLQSDCDDLRIVYQNVTDLARTYQLATGATNCSDSKGTIVTFKLQASLTSGSSDSTNYALYYGNSGAGGQSNPKVKYLSFDGSNDYVNLGDPVSCAFDFGLGDFTFGGWFKTSTSQNLSIIAKYGGTPYYFLRQNNGNVVCEMRSGVGTRAVASTGMSYNDGTWHYATCVRSGGATATLCGWYSEGID